MTMSGLIPLMLNRAMPGNRWSTPPAKQLKGDQSTDQPPSQPSQTPPPPAQSRHTSLYIPSRSSSLQVPPRANPTKLTKPVKRLSLAASPPSLPVLPYTATEWTRTIAEVKRQHVSRRYRACLTRCNEILDNIKDSTSIEPAYLISLHFYAATSLEMCARPIIAPSVYRDSLFQKARAHYDQADALISRAEDAIFSKSRPCSFISTSSSVHSSCGSISSPAFTAETSVSSPTPSVCSSEDLGARSRLSQQSICISPLVQPQPRKQVCFEIPPEREQPVRIEPFIRPDSPTLGFEDEYFTSALNRTQLPEVPKRPKTPEIVEPILDDMTPRAPRVNEDPFQLDHRDSFSRRDHIRDSFLMGPSATRYCIHLAGLKSQLAMHRQDLKAIVESPNGDSDKSLLTRPWTPLSDELRDLDRKERIERLRKNGWQRKRFDPSRYEALRTTVLAELV